MSKDKLIRLRVDDKSITTILNDLLELNIKDNLKGLVIIARTDEGDKNESRIHRFFFDEGSSCVNVLGLIEYMKAHILDYIREFGEL